MIELESVKLGVVSLILGAMHFFNILVFARMRQRATSSPNHYGATTSIAPPPAAVSAQATA